MATVAEAISGDNGIDADRSVNVGGVLNPNTDRTPSSPQLGIGTGRAEGSKATQFKARASDPTAPRSAKPKPAPRPQPSQLLRAMRHVFLYDPDDDQTYAHQHCREWLEDDPKGFLARLADLEKAHASRQR